jgi:hypothetical protein
MRNVNIILVRKPERMKPLGRPEYGWEDNFKNVLKKQGVRMWT